MNKFASQREVKPEDRPTEDLIAANEFVISLIPRADQMHHDAPLWYGWAVTTAFLAGIDHARAAIEQHKEK